MNKIQRDTSDLEQPMMFKGGERLSTGDDGNGYVEGLSANHHRTTSIDSTVITYLMIMMYSSLRETIGCL